MAASSLFWYDFSPGNILRHVKCSNLKIRARDPESLPQAEAVENIALDRGYVRIGHRGAEFSMCKLKIAQILKVNVLGDFINLPTRQLPIFREYFSLSATTIKKTLPIIYHHKLLFSKVCVEKKLKGK